jgi:putative aldouronate transport system substrate-binding protein
VNNHPYDDIKILHKKECIMKKLFLFLLVLFVSFSVLYAEGTKEDAAEEKTVITMFSNREPPPLPFEDTPVGQKIMEALNAEIDIEWTVGDAATKVGIMVASGDFPETLAISSDLLDQFKEAGALVELTDYVENSSELARTYPADYLEAHKDENGEIYFISDGVPMLASFDYPPKGFHLQQKILKEIGWPRFLTFEDYVDVIIDYAEDNPTFDGQPIIGYIAHHRGWKFDMFTNTPSELAGRIGDGGVFFTEKNGHYTPHLVTGTDAEKRFLRNLNKLHQAGLFDEEGFVHSEEQFKAKLASGRVLGGYVWRYMTLGPATSLRERGYSENRLVPIPVAYDEDIVPPYRKEPSFKLDGGFAITTAAKNPDKIWDVMVTKWLSDEVQTLARWGIEGEHYYEEDGVYKMTEDQMQFYHFAEEEDKQRAGFIGGEFRHWVKPSPKLTMENGNYFYPYVNPKIQGFRYVANEEDREFLEAYDLDAPGELFKIREYPPYGETWNFKVDDEAKVQKQMWDDFRRSWVPQLVMADEGTFDSVWNDYTDAFEDINVSAWLETCEEIGNLRVETGNPALNP